MTIQLVGQRKYIRLLGSCLFGTALSCAAPLQAQIVHVWDLANVDQPGQLTIYNPDENDAEFGTPIRSGDLNGDGFDDFIVSAMAADGPLTGRANAGEVAVYFSPGHFEGAVDLAENQPTSSPSTVRHHATSSVSSRKVPTSTGMARMI